MSTDANSQQGLCLAGLRCLLACRYTKLSNVYLVVINVLTDWLRCRLLSSVVLTPGYNLDSSERNNSYSYTVCPLHAVNNSLVSILRYCTVSTLHFTTPTSLTPTTHSDDTVQHLQIREAPTGTILVGLVIKPHYLET